MFEKNEVWEAIDSKLIGAKRGSKGFMQINCPMCVSMGTSQDTRRRCGIKYEGDQIGINCFNCGFKTKYIVGEQLPKKMQNFMDHLGVSESEINKVQYWAWIYYKNTHKQEIYNKPIFRKPIYEKKDFEDESKTISFWLNEKLDYPKFIRAANYVSGRSHSANPDDIYWSPKFEDYIMIPCKFNGNMVGWTARATDDEIKPKYSNTFIPKDFIFNCDVMTKSDRKYLIIVEGIFDAIAIDGVSLMTGAKITDYQIQWLNNCPLTKIVVPHKDDTGKRLIKAALDNNWYLSLPSISTGNGNRWHSDIKDVDEAVKKYGKLWTLHSILKHITNNKIIIENISQKI